MKQLVTAALSAAAFFTATACALAQDVGDFPKKGQIHLVVPLPAGSAADSVARIVGKKLGEKLGQVVIVENRPGASGVIGTDYIARAKPDGYTLGIATTTTLVTASLLTQKMPYDPKTDLIPVAMVGVSPFVVVVSPKVKATTFQELVALAKAKPDEISYSTDGEASLARLACELLSQKIAAKFNPIPYHTSTAAVVDLLEGRIDMQFGILTTTHQFIKDGKLRALAVATHKRIDEFPNIPTIEESGVPGFEAVLWLGVIAPKGTPQPIVDLLNKTINEALGQDDVKTAFAAQHIQVETQTPAQMKEQVSGDLEKWSEAAKAAGVGKK